MKDIVFLLGAGASYGAGSILPEQPPLGHQLFSRLEHCCPRTWGNLPNEFRQGLREDFEQGMGEVYRKLGRAIPALMRDMAVYWVQFRPHHQNSLYCRLVADLDRIGILSRILFSTLNYDWILEQSLIQKGYKVTYSGTGLPGEVPVWKLHGSCNMFPHNINARGMLYDTEVVWNGDVQAFFDPNEVLRYCLVDTALAPVMCLYMPGKPVGVSPKVVKQIQESWKNILASASTMICIGVRPWPEDIHIWSPLTSTPANLYFIGDREPFSQWHETRSGPAEHIGDRFNEAYPELIRRLETHGLE